MKFNKKRCIFLILLFLSILFFILTGQKVCQTLSGDETNKKEVSFGALRQHLNKFNSILKEIEVKQILDEKSKNVVNIFSPLVNNEGGLTSDDGLVVNNIFSNSPQRIEIIFSRDIYFDGFSFFFYGNLHSVNSVFSPHFILYHLDSNDNWILLKEVKNHYSPYYRFIAEKTIKTKGIKIEFVSAYYNNTVWIKDLKFFRKEKVRFAQSFLYFIRENRYSLPFYWFYYLLFISIFIFPGFLVFKILEEVKALNLDPELKLIFSPVFSIILMFFGATIYLVTGIREFLNLYFFIFLICFFLFIKKGLYKDLFKARTPLIFMMVALSIFFLTIAHRDYLFNMQYIQKYLDSKVPIPTQEVYIGYFADNLFPWRISRVFLRRISPLGKEAKEILIDTQVFDRTPLLPLITTGILNFFGESHFIYERFLEVLGVLIFGAFYVLVKRYFSKNTALLTLFLILLNIQISFMPFNAEYFYKYFAIYPIILATILLVNNSTYYEKKWFICFLLCLSFLIHPFTLFVISGIIFVWFLKYSSFSKFLKDIFLPILPLFFLVALWILLPHMLKIKTLQTVPNSLYFSLFYRRVLLGAKQGIVKNKLIGLAYLIFPNITLRGVNAEKISFFSREFLFQFFRYSLISNLTPLFFLFALKYLIYDLKNKRNFEFIILSLWSLLVYWLIYINAREQAFNYGGFYFHFYTFVVPIFISIVVRHFLKSKSPFGFFVVVSYILFMGFNLYYISGNFIFPMKCGIRVVNSLFYLIIICYLILSFLTIFFFKNLELRKRK